LDIIFSSDTDISVAFQSRLSSAHVAVAVAPVAAAVLGMRAFSLSDVGLANEGEDRKKSAFINTKNKEL